MSSSNSKAKILFQMTGSIACYKACILISKLVQSNYDVQIATSNSALRFVGQATLEGLTGKPVYSDLWKSGSMMDHIYLNRWADLVITAPATAGFLNRAAHGTGDDLLTTLFLSHDFSKPYLIAPAMNASMYQHPTTQESIQKLKKIGIQILETASGVLACGESGYGKLLEPELLFREIENALTKKLTPKNINILITSGGTAEPLDDVRVLTNKSTGATGAAIADDLVKQGYGVTYLHAKSAVLPKNPCKKIEFETFLDLRARLQELLSEDYFAIIHAAAVSDFSIEKRDGKISSKAEPLLQLKRNPKLVDNIRTWSKNKKIKLIAFKMTSAVDEVEKALAVKKLFDSSLADLIVHNDIHEFSWNEPKHIFHIYDENRTLNMVARNKQELASALTKYLEVM